MNRAEKETSVAKLARDFETHPTAFAIDYRGLRVDEATELRRKVRASGSIYRVMKNTLALRAIRGTPLEPLGEHFKGMTGLAYTATDPVTLAKVLTDFAKEVPALTFKGGILSGRLLTPAELQELASLPAREELLAKLLYLLEAPLQRLLAVLQAPARDLLLVLKAAEQKRKEQ